MMRMRFRNLALPRGGGAPAPPEVAAPKFRPPGPALRKRASSRGTAPEAAACEPQPRKGGGIVRRKASRRGEPPAANAASETSLSDVGSSSSPPPEMPAARSGGIGLTAAALESAAEGEFFALRNTLAQAVSGAGSRGREGAAPPQRLAAVSADIMRRFAPRTFELWRWTRAQLCGRRCVWLSAWMLASLGCGLSSKAGMGRSCLGELCSGGRGGGVDFSKMRWTTLHGTLVSSGCGVPSREG